MQVRDLVRVPDDPAFGRLRLAPRSGLEAAFRRRAVLEDAVERLVREVQPCPVLLELLGDAHALRVVAETVGQELREELLTDVAERRVADVVAERHRLDQILVQPERAGDRPADLAHLEDVREPGAVVVAHGREEHLRLVLRAPEGLAVDDAVAVDGEIRPRRRRLLGLHALRVHALRRVGSERRLLELLGVLPDAQGGNALTTGQLGIALYSGRHTH